MRVLEAGAEVGGRTKTVAVAGAPVNTGALFVHEDTMAETLATELGLELVPFRPATYGIHCGGTTAVSTDDGQPRGGPPGRPGPPSRRGRS